jgi:hypothetical protein
MATPVPPVPTENPTPIGTVLLEQTCPLCKEQLTASVIPGLASASPRLEVVGKTDTAVRMRVTVEAAAEVRLRIEHQCPRLIPFREVGQ